MDQATIICRCEEISYEEIAEVLRHGARTFDDVKRLTRCGMGPCQAKMCMRLVAQVIQAETGRELSEIPPARIRMPLSPLKLETLATNRTTFSAVKSVLDEVEPEEGMR